MQPLCDSELPPQVGLTIDRPSHHTTPDDPRLPPTVESTDHKTFEVVMDYFERISDTVSTIMESKIFKVIVVTALTLVGLLVPGSFLFVILAFTAFALKYLYDNRDPILKCLCS